MAIGEDDGMVDCLGYDSAHRLGLHKGTPLSRQSMVPPRLSTPPGSWV
jgi:hypothetical protein